MIIKNATLQTLFPFWKIAIFRRIAPRKKNATLQTLFPYWKIAIFGRIAPTYSSHRLKSSP